MSADEPYFIQIQTNLKSTVVATTKKAIYITIDSPLIYQLTSALNVLATQNHT